jgi:esterase/lipase superfamily enzyme
MHRFWRLVPALALLAAVAACGSLGHVVPAPRADAPAVIEPVFVASIRAQGKNGGQGSEPAAAISYTSYDVSVPPQREPGQSPRYSSHLLDPVRDFVITNVTAYPSQAAFGRAVTAASVPDEAFVYVHGFNTKYSSSVYQLAQIGADIAMPGARVLFAWPAEQRVSSYLRDARVAVESSKALADVIEGLALSGVKRITLVGYSLGAVVVFEAVRELRRAHSPALRRLGGVVLLSPDIDLAAFHDAAVEMGGLPQPFVVYGSPDDLPLRAVEVVLSHGKPRLGRLPDPSALADLAITYVDTDYVPELSQPGHLPVATAPSMIEAINAMPKPDMILYAEEAAAGRFPGVEVRHYGKLTYVTLPEP